MNLLIIRLIIFAVVFFVGLKLYGRYRQWQHDRQALEHARKRHEGGQMVRCQWCDVHVPASEALRADGRWFCSSAHRDRYANERASDDRPSNR